MATAAERERADTADPVHADPVQTGVQTDDAKADPEAKLPRGVKLTDDGRQVYPWEVDAKKQVGPAGELARKRS